MKFDTIMWVFAIIIGIIAYTIVIKEFIESGDYLFLLFPTPVWFPVIKGFIDWKRNRKK